MKKARISDAAQVSGMSVHALNQYFRRGILRRQPVAGWAAFSQNELIRIGVFGALVRAGLTVRAAGKLSRSLKSTRTELAVITAQSVEIEVDVGEIRRAILGRE